MAAMPARSTPGTVHQQIAVADPGIELQLAARQFALQVVDEALGELVGDLAGGETFHHAVLNRDKVAANRPVVGAQLNSLGGGFERRAAGVEFERVVSKQAHRRHVAAGGH
jgi:hypothetical protein